MAGDPITETCGLQVFYKRKKTSKLAAQYLVAVGAVLFKEQLGKQQEVGNAGEGSSSVGDELENTDASAWSNQCRYWCWKK